MQEGHINEETQLDTSPLEKSKAQIIVEIIEYIPNSIVSKTIIKKTTGNITVSSFDTGEELAEKISPFDIYVQIIDGSADIVINDIKYTLKLGEGIVIPAHAPTEQFKMVTTIIKTQTSIKLIFNYKLCLH
jgi:hypothetical protein